MLILAYDDQIFVLLFCFDDFLRFNFFRVFRVSLLWIMAELAGGGSVAVAVGISDR